VTEAYPFKYMFSADLFVSDMYKQVEFLTQRLGFHNPGPNSVVSDSSDAHATMCRLRRSIDEAPTRLEIIHGTGLLDHWNGYHIQEAWNSQVERPVRFHNTVFVADLEQVSATLNGRSVPFIQDSTLDFTRLWVGISPDEPTKYDASFDSGLRIEVLPFDYFGIAEAGKPLDELEAEPGDMLRVVERSFLVEDLDLTVGTLDQSLGWRPASAIEEDPRSGCRRATFNCQLGHGASLLLLEPFSFGTFEGSFFQRWGPGPYSITIAVYDLDAKAAAMSGHGIPFTTVGNGSLLSRRLRVGADVVGSTILEYVDAEVVEPS
jgi:hypothetical protein